MYRLLKVAVVQALLFGLAILLGVVFWNPRLPWLPFAFLLAWLFLPWRWIAGWPMFANKKSYTTKWLKREQPPDWPNGRDEDFSDRK